MGPASALLALVALTASPALAWDAPETVVGAYRLGPPGATGGEACDIELLASMAHEFEGVWYVARPLHYEDNREACRRLGLDDVIAWSGGRDSTLWVLAEGEARFMEFAIAGDAWHLIKSGHSERPDLVLKRTADVD